MKDVVGKKEDEDPIIIIDDQKEEEEEEEEDIVYMGVNPYISTTLMQMNAFNVELLHLHYKMEFFDILAEAEKEKEEEIEE